MKLEDCKKGMKVRTRSKSIWSKSYDNFLEHYPDGVAPIKVINGSNVALGDGAMDWLFSPEDLELYEEAKEMKLEDYEVGMKVRLKLGKIDGTGLLIEDKYPDLEGEIVQISSLSDPKLPFRIGPENWWFRLDQIMPYEEEIHLGSGKTITIEGGKVMKYKELKLITLDGIFDETSHSACFMRQFAELSQLCDLAGGTEISLGWLEKQFPDHLDWAPWFVNNRFIEEVKEEEWRRIKWQEIGRLQPGVKVKRDFYGHVEFFTIAEEPRLEYHESLGEKTLVCAAKSGDEGGRQLHYISDLFNGDVYILEETES